MPKTTTKSQSDAVQRLTSDLIAASHTLTDQEARFLVDAFYIIQEDRKRSKNQVDAAAKSGEPNRLLDWFYEQNRVLERQIYRALDGYTESHPMGAWMRNIYGIGVVLSAGFLAHIDMDRAPTVGHIWKLAGWAADGQTKWEKGTKRPYSTPFRTLCWKAGECFVKMGDDERNYYGKLYSERREYENAKNEAGQYADQAAAGAARVAKSTEAYKSYSVGKLPLGHLHARARRYAVKQFLADLHGEWYRVKFGKEAPLPYPIVFLGHAHVRRSPYTT